jgi:hypothetical protein
MRPCNELLAQYLDHLELQQEYVRQRSTTSPLLSALRVSEALATVKVLPSGRSLLRIRVN